MKFALTSRQPDGRQVWFIWSDEPGLLAEGATHWFATSETAMERHVRKAVQRGKQIGRHNASLEDPYIAYLTLVTIMREQGILGPIDFAGTDDDGEPMTFMPAPEADHLIH